MTDNWNGALWARGDDLARLFAAGRICYLFGGYDGSGNYGDILQLHASVERLKTAGQDIVPAPLVYWRYAEDHDALLAGHPWLFGDSCFLYYAPANELEDAAASLGNHGRVRLTDPPRAFSQAIVYGGGFFNTWWGWGSHKLDLIDLVESWLGDVSPDGKSLAIVGQQISSDFMFGTDADRFAALLARASTIGLRDELSLQNLRQWGGHEASDKLVITGDDATIPIIARKGEHRESEYINRSIAGALKQPTVVNLHLNMEPYVTTAPRLLLKTFEAVLHSLRRNDNDDLTVNLLVAYDDSRISETSFIERLQESPTAEGCTINVVSCIDELRHHFPNIGKARLTVACSYHVALTSLLLGIPTAFVYSNEYYRHKVEGLKRSFQLPDEVLLDVQSGSRDEFTAALERIVCDDAHHAELSAYASQGAARATLLSSSTSVILSDFLTTSYLSTQETRFQKTNTKLLDTMEQLSDLKREHGKLLNTATSLSTSHSAALRAQRRNQDSYQRTIKEVRSAVRENLPGETNVLIVSRGDNRLLNLAGRTGGHFPQTPSGAYAGHHPADSDAAVKHLEELRTKGAEYVIFPNTTFWWLDYYGGLARHLNQSHRKVFSNQHCIIYQLLKVKAPSRPGRGKGKGKRQPAKAAAKQRAARPPELANDPIIIYGPPRSGTSYLLHILNRHPNVFITPETRVLVWAHRTLREETQEFFSVFKHRDLYIDYLQRKYPDLIRDFYRELNEKKAHYWGDKNPHYAAADSAGCLQTILDLYPGTRFINIIRDGRGNVTSLIKKGWADFEKAHRTWLGHVDTGTAFGRRLTDKQYFELRYEDLIQDDTAMARRIFDFLEIEIHPKVVKFCDAQSTKRAPINQPERDISGDLTKSDWDTVLTTGQQLRSLDLLGDHLIAFGYETEESLDEIRNGLREESSPGLVRSVGSAVRGALQVRANGHNRDARLP